MNRAAAVLLAIAWWCAGIAGVYFGITVQRFSLAGAGVLAIGCALLWTKVAVRAGLLSWREVLRPWRMR